MEYKCRFENWLEKKAHCILVQNSAICFLVLLVSFLLILAGCVPIIHLALEVTDITALATVALALTGIAGLVGASLASYENAEIYEAFSSSRTGKFPLAT